MRRIHLHAATRHRKSETPLVKIVSAGTKPAASVYQKMIKNVTGHFAKFGKLEINLFIPIENHVPFWILLI
jgi:hypothetical protein